MAFENGNKHGAKARLFDSALKRAIAQDDGARLRKAAETLLTLASEGERWAVEMLADRLDGKAHQSVTVEPRNIEEMTLDQLRAAVVTAIAGDSAPGASAPEPGAVH
jgi:hypothetical protein